MEDSSQSLTDKELWDGFVRDGGEEFLSALLERYKLTLFNIAFRVLYDRYGAEDVVQKVFVKLARRKDELINVGSPQLWLYASTLNMSLDVQESMKRRKKREKAQENSFSTETPRDAAIRSELRSELDIALESLSSSLRIPLVLRYLQGLSYAEVGEAMDLSSDTVRKRVKKGLGLLKKLLIVRGLAVPVVAIEAGLRTIPAKAARADFLASAGSIIKAASAAGVGTGVAGTAASVLKGGLIVTAKSKIATGIGAALLLAGAIIYFAPKTTDRSQETPSRVEKRALPDRADSVVEGEQKRGGVLSPMPEPGISRQPVEAEDFDISGKVIDRAGNPLEGARVYILVRDTTPGDERRLMHMTERDGTFGFRCPDAKEYSLVVSKQDYVRVEQFFTGPQKDIVIMMLLGGAIEGKVVDAVTDEPLNQFRIEESRDDGFPREEEIYPSDMGKLFRNREGRFRLSGLETGTYTLTSIAEGYAQSSAKGIKVDLEKVTTDVVIKQQPAGGIRGRVVDAMGNPIEWAEIVQRTHLADEYPSLARTLATSDPKGEFQIGGLPAGTFTFEARHGHYSPAEREVEVKRGEITEGVEFQLVQGGSISGTVVAEADLSPIAGAKVRLQVGPRDPHNIMTHSGGTTTETDYSGHFQFPNVKPGTYYLSASAIEFAYETVDDVKLEENKPLTNLTIKLSRGGRLVGTVRDQSGKPMAGVEVHAVCVLMQKRARTDKEGNYVITNLKEGKYSAGVAEVSTSTLGRSEHYEIQIENGKETRLDIVIGGALKVHGKVTRGGQPQAGLEVVLQSSLKTGVATKSFVTASDKTDPDGYYEIGNLKPGEYTLIVTSVPLRTEIVLADADVEKNIQLPEGGISGRVLDAETGKPIEGVKVGFQPRQARDLLEAYNLKRGYRPSDTTDSEGRYKFSGVEDGLYFVLAEKDGYAPQASSAEVHNSQGPSDLNLLLSRGTTLRGRATGTDPSRPVQEIFLSARDSNGLIVHSGNMNLTPDGEYETAVLSPGEYAISVEGKGYAPATKKVRVVAGADNRADFVLPAGGTLILRVVDDTGNLVPGVQRKVLDEEGNYWLPFFPATEDTWQEGVSVTPHLSAGEYRVELSAPGYRDESLNVIVREADTTDMTVRLKESR